MIDTRFYINKAPHSLFEIAKLIDCDFASAHHEDIKISNITTLELAESSDLTFFSNKKYEKAFYATRAGACIVDKTYKDTTQANTILLISKNPYMSYAKAIDLFYEAIKPKKGDAIHSSVKIGKNCNIGYNVVIESGVEIGDNATIGAHSFIGHGVKIGDRARVDSGVTINYSIIGDDVVILPGARIGQDGFGFATHHGKHHKIFHAGRVLIGNDVEVGANTTIDRGGILDTIISDGCRIDNLVQIGHNVYLGKGSIIVAQAGIAGSSVIGNYCALGGQVGIAGHLKIADGVQIAGQGGAIQDITTPGVVLGGTPAVPIKDWHRQSIFLKNLSGKK